MCCAGRDPTPLQSLKRKVAAFLEDQFPWERNDECGLPLFLDQTDQTDPIDNDDLL